MCKDGSAYSTFFGFNHPDGFMDWIQKSVDPVSGLAEFLRMTGWIDQIFKRFSMDLSLCGQAPDILL